MTVEIKFAVHKQLMEVKHSGFLCGCELYVETGSCDTKYQNIYNFHQFSDITVVFQKDLGNILVPDNIQKVHVLKT